MKTSIVCTVYGNCCGLSSWERGHEARGRQASQGLTQLKSVKESQALPFLSSREIGHQAMGKQASKVVSNSTTRHLRAWSKTMGIAILGAL